MTALTLKPESGESKLFQVPVSTFQKWALVSGDKIQGTLKYMDEDNQITRAWGNGYFIAVKFLAKDWDEYTSVQVGLDPSAGSGLVEVIDDPDKNGVFKITNKDGQKFVIVATNGTETKRQEFDLSTLSFTK